MYTVHRQTGRMHNFDLGRDAVDACVLFRDSHRACVDVAREHVAPQRLRGGDGEHAGAGADVEDMVRAARP